MLELLRARRRRVRRLFATARAHDPELAAAAAAAGVGVEVVGEEEIARRARTEVPQGLVALAEEPAPRALQDLTAGAGGAPAFLVVLDHVTDPHNLGAVLRSAVGAGVSGVVLARQRAAHLSPAAVKAAAGAVEHLDFALVAGVPAALGVLKAAGVWTVALDAGAGTDLEDVAVLRDRVALVLGEEGRGLAPLVARRCDVRAAITLAGPLGSLNVSAAAAIACFTVARHRRVATRERPAAEQRAASPDSPLV